MNKIAIQVLVLLLVLVTGFLAVSTHVLILQNFSPPAVKSPLSPLAIHLVDWIHFVIQVATVLSVFLVYLNSKEHLQKFKKPHQIILLAILMLALTEQLLRTPVMQIIVGVPWGHQILLTLPVYSAYFFMAFVVVSIRLKLVPKNQFLRWSVYFLLSSVAAIIIIYLKSYVTMLVDHYLKSALHLVEQKNTSLQTLPSYGFHVLLFAYITFLEPTIASFMIFYLIKNKLQIFNTFIQAAIFSSLIMLAHGGFYIFSAMVTSIGNIFYRLFYLGQFLWEYIVLGFLTVYSFAFIDYIKKKSVGCHG